MSDATSDDAPAQPRGPKLVAGAAIAGGRYRLLEPHGGARGLKFWRARDVKLNREVGLTFVDPEQRAPASSGDAHPDGPQDVLNRTRRLGQLHTAGVARVLDVVRGASGGIIVTEWVPGSSLADVASTEPSATGAARAVRTLAAAAEAAHRAGAVLSIDHPDRIRLSIDGDAVLAFPAVMAGDTRATDVRGLGAVLYALLVNRWPLCTEDGRELVTTAETDEPIGGMEPAAPDVIDTDDEAARETAARRPLPPRKADSRIPFEISAVATRALEGNHSIRTAGTVQHILDQATVVDLPTDVIPREISDRPPLSVAPISRTRKERLLGEGRSGKRNGALLIGGGLFIVFLVIALVLWLADPFGDKEQNDLDSFLPPSSSGQTAKPPMPKTEPVVAQKVTVFDPSGESDATAVQNLGNVLTGKQPAWRTSQWNSPAFGGAKPGLGLLLAFDGPTSIVSVQIDTPTPGIKLDLRATDNPNAKVNTMLILGSAQLSKKSSTITVQTPQKAKYLLLWITELPSDGSGGYQAVVSRIVTKRQ
ncbi:MAG: protein kinase family protein [Gordonia sp. (in: high G+C Gram-positive bacteria)]